MFCPSCGEQNSVKQKFCRKCGMNLEQTAALMQSMSPSTDHMKQARLAEKFGSVAFAGLGVVVVLGILAVIYAILDNMVLSGRRPVAGLLLVTLVIFAALSLSYVIWNEVLKEKRTKLSRDPEHGEEMPRSTG